MGSFRRIVPLILVIAVGLAACGGDATPTGSTGNGNGNGATNSPPAGNVFTAADCASAALAMAAAASGGLGGSQSGSGSFEDSVATLDRMADGAPAGVKDDIQTLAAATAAYLKALKDAGVDLSNPSTLTNPDKAQAVGRAAAAYQSSGAQAAADRVDSYFDEKCPNS